MKLVKGAEVLLVEGTPGSGKSAAAAATALLTIRSGGTVLWIDPLGGSLDYFDPAEEHTGVETIRPLRVRPFSADDFVEAARGKTLVVIDHARYDTDTRRKFVAEARRLADLANVRVLVTLTSLPGLPE